MMLDSLAKRYGCLPSEVLQRSDSLDILVLNTASKWEKHCEENSKDGKVPPMIPASELQDMMARVRKRSEHDEDPN